MGFATIGAMPRAIVAVGVAVLFGGCGKVSFGPLGDGGADVGPEDLGVPDMPDVGMPDYGPPPDGGADCKAAPPAPMYPGAFTTWPFGERSPIEKRVVYTNLFWMDASRTEMGCTAPNCHGNRPEENAMAGAPLFPVDSTLLNSDYDRAISELWDRIKMSSDNPPSGPLFAHLRDYGTPDAKAKESWTEGSVAFGPKIEFVRSILDRAQRCDLYQWIGSYNDQLCTATSSGTPSMDAGAGNPDDCYCPTAFEPARASLGDTTGFSDTCPLHMN